MNLFFQDPNEIRLPPGEVHICNLQLFPRADGSQVKVSLELSPFQQRPNIEVIITAEAGKEIAHSTILEVMLPKIDFTLHLRLPKPGVQYTAEAIVYYQKLPEPTETPVDIPLPAPLIVDRRRAIFTLPPSSA